MLDKHRDDEIQNQIYEFMTIFVVVGWATQQKDDKLERQDPVENDDYVDVDPCHR